MSLRIPPGPSRTSNPCKEFNPQTLPRPGLSSALQSDLCPLHSFPTLSLFPLGHLRILFSACSSASGHLPVGGTCAHCGHLPWDICITRIIHLPRHSLGGCDPLSHICAPDNCAASSDVFRGGVRGPRQLGASALRHDGIPTPTTWV